MAFFGVTVEKIESLKPIEGADRIVMCKLEDLAFEFVVKKGDFQVGQRVLYFPLDAIIPEPVLEKLGLVDKLAGAQKNRVKTVKLRGQISQGLVSDLSLIDDMPMTDLAQLRGLGATPEAITEYLGVTKYEPSEPHTGGNVGAGFRTRANLPDGLSVYDIEGCERNSPAILELALQGNVMITEKVEGSNFSIVYDRDIHGSAEEWYGEAVKVCSRRQTIIHERDRLHPFWQTALEQELDETVYVIALREHAQRVAIYGEFIGPRVQGNIYKLDKWQIRVFDIKVNNHFMNADKFKYYTDRYGIITAPVLAYDVDLLEWINDQIPRDWNHMKEFTIDDAATGESQLYKRLREGIVIKPMIERYSPSLRSRLILKQRSKLYLANEK